MSEYTCGYCDPKFYVIYGFCGRCERRCEPPLFDPEGKVSLLDYEEFRCKWNRERSHLILDEIRKGER